MPSPKCHWLHWLAEVVCLQGLLYSIFQHSVQTYFVCQDCTHAKTLAAPQPGWVFSLARNTTPKLEDAMEEFFMARSLEYKVQCTATSNKESGVECRRMCRLWSSTWAESRLVLCNALLNIQP